MKPPKPTKATANLQSSWNLLPLIRHQSVMMISIVNFNHQRRRLQFHYHPIIFKISNACVTITTIFALRSTLIWHHSFSIISTECRNLLECWNALHWWNILECWNIVECWNVVECWIILKCWNTLGGWNVIRFLKYYNCRYQTVFTTKGCQFWMMVLQSVAHFITFHGFMYAFNTKLDLLKFIVSLKDISNF